jgi:hypothetical protein
VDAIMHKLERLAYWKAVAVDELRAAGATDVAEFENITFETEDQLYGYFQCFRPDGKGVDRVFAGIVGGGEIVQRLRQVYECTSDSSGPYFIVRRPAPADPEKLMDLTTQHYLKVREFASAIGHAEHVRELEVLPKIEIRRERIPDRARSDVFAPEASVYDVTGDWFAGLERIQSEALLLHEAFYSIACDYKIAHHLMWPLYRYSTEIEEPFAPYFELWTHGALPFFEKPGLVNVYVAGDS